jgi:uncharacterized membrane protein YsdA (DUF1294 family)/cold shock CspA family protein
MRVKGRIASWNDDKGFGFISAIPGGKQIFIHVSALSNRGRRPEVGEIVTYGLSKDKQGRPCAVNATLAGDKLKKKESQKSSTPAIAFALLSLFAVGISVTTGNLPLVIGIAYCSMSLITFIAYAVDKSAAQIGAWRTPESTLHLLGLAGGWPGALVAQQTMRHKSKKGSFRVVLLVTIIINCLALAWLHTENGGALLDSLLSRSP